MFSVELVLEHHHRTTHVSKHQNGLADSVTSMQSRHAGSRPDEECAGLVSPVVTGERQVDSMQGSNAEGYSLQMVPVKADAKLEVRLL